MKLKVLCGGCFNRLHEGHIYFLRTAKSLGRRIAGLNGQSSVLVVVLSSDPLTKRKYGRNAAPAEERMKNIERLGIADKVVVGFHPANFKKTIQKYKPDIVALGYDQNIELGRAGLKIVRIPKLSPYGGKKQGPCAKPSLRRRRRR